MPWSHDRTKISKRQAMERQPRPGWQELGVASRQGRDQERVQRQRAERDGGAPVLREARDERSDGTDAGLRVDDQAHDVRHEESRDEDPQVVVPREDPLRQLPRRLVVRVAEHEADGHLQRRAAAGSRCRWPGPRARSAARPGDRSTPEGSGRWRRSGRSRGGTPARPPRASTCGTGPAERGRRDRRAADVNGHGNPPAVLASHGYESPTGEKVSAGREFRAMPRCRAGRVARRRPPGRAARRGRPSERR